MASAAPRQKLMQKTVWKGGGEQREINVEITKVESPAWLDDDSLPRERPLSAFCPQSGPANKKKA
jgi:hypothetical protein